MEVAIITFHAAHNYGSMLQAYALQSFLKSIDYNAKIINFCPLSQENLYSLFPKEVSWKTKLKASLRMILYPSTIKKHFNFKLFLKNYLDTTPKYKSVNELKKKCPVFDVYISGSDQIWNSEIDDFSDAYLLSFVEHQRRVSYAASFGPIGIISATKQEMMREELNRYRTISVREEKSVALIQEMIHRTVPVMPDPTLLLTRHQWDAILPDNFAIPKQEYILLYALCDEPELDNITDFISKNLDLPVVITKYLSGSKFFTYFKYKRKTTCGPREFLSLLKNSKFVLSASFHGTVFSIIYQKPFFVYKGVADARISTLLKNTNLLERAITAENMEGRISKAYQIDFSQSESFIQTERKRAVQFLQKALEK